MVAPLNGFFPPWKGVTITATISFLSLNKILALCEKKKHLQAKEDKHVCSFLLNVCSASILSTGVMP